MKDAGVDVGEVKGGYYPREFDVDAVMRDPKGFIDAAARAYRSMGMAPDVARRRRGAARRHGVRRDEHAVQAASAARRARRSSRAACSARKSTATHPLNKFLCPTRARAGEILRARAKRAEIARRFGDNFANWDDISRKIIDEGGGAILQKLPTTWRWRPASRNRACPTAALRAASVARTWGALMFLEKATLSSLTEFMVPAVRSGNVLDAGRSLKNTLAELFTKTRRRRGAPRVRRRPWPDLRAHLQLARVRALRRRRADGARRIAGARPLLQAHRPQPMDRRDPRRGRRLARVFIRRLAKDMEKDGNLTKRYPRRAWACRPSRRRTSRSTCWRAATACRCPAISTGSLGDVYRVAVRKFVSQAIMDPTHGCGRSG
jgi:hypothetical protein